LGTDVVLWVGPKGAPTYMPGNHKPPRWRHFAGVKIMRTTETPTGTGWVTPDGRFTFYQDPKATKTCKTSHPIGKGAAAYKCPGGIAHTTIWWYIIDNHTKKRAFGSPGGESLTDTVVIMLNGLKRETQRSA
jgi:hypothetical protein